MRAPRTNLLVECQLKPLHVSQHSSREPSLDSPRRPPLAFDPSSQGRLRGTPSQREGADMETETMEYDELITTTDEHIEDRGNNGIC